MCSQHDNITQPFTPIRIGEPVKRVTYLSVQRAYDEKRRAPKNMRGSCPHRQDVSEISGAKYHVFRRSNGSVDSDAAFRYTLMGRKANISTAYYPCTDFSRNSFSFLVLMVMVDARVIQLGSPLARIARTRS